MAASHLAYPDLALDRFSGTDPDQDAESFIQLIERKINFALGDAPANVDALANYNFRKKALFSSLLRGPAAEWYGSTIEAATPWEDIRTNFITRFSDGRNKFRHRLEVEHCVRRDGEEIRYFLHRIKKTEDKGWPDDMNGIARAQQNAERDAQARQQRQRYMDYSLKGLRPRYLQRKAQEYLMEHPNATWNDFSTHIIQKDVFFQVSSNFLNDEEQTKAELASLGQEMKNLRTELQEHRVNVVEGTSKPVDPNQKGRQNATRFCNYCRTNGHTPSWCRKKIREEELKKIENERTAEKELPLRKIIIRKEDQAMGPNNGITIKTLLTDLILIMDRKTRAVDDYLTDDQINSPTETMEIDQLTEVIITKMELGEIMAILLVHHQDRDGIFHKAILSANLTLFNLEIRHLEDQMETQPLVLLLTNKNFLRATVKHQRTWFVSPPLTIALTNYRNFVR